MLYLQVNPLLSARVVAVTDSDPSTPEPASTARRGKAVGCVVVISVILIVILGASAAHNWFVISLAGVLISLTALTLVGDAVMARFRAGQRRRMQALAGDQLVFTFQSTRWFQHAVMQLRAAGTIDPDVLTDSENPTGGPRWASATTDGLSIWRGYSPSPYFTLHWSIVTEVFREIESSRAMGDATKRDWAPGISVIVTGGPKPVNLILRAPIAHLRPRAASRQVAVIVDELNELRGVTPPES